MRKLVFVTLLFLGFVVLTSRIVSGQSLEDIKKKIEQYEAEVVKLQSQAKTLSSQIANFDAQIILTSLKISQTQEEIKLRTERIDRLEVSIGSLSNAFSQRALETYRLRKSGNSFAIILASDSLSQVFQAFYSLRKIQEQDRGLLRRLLTAQEEQREEKADFEDLEEKLESQKKELARQKQDKANLLVVTRNNEKKFQELLAAARAELAVVLGQGSEKFLRDVAEGDVIGRVILSASGCSSGQHLHFEVHQGGSVVDPSSFLRPISFIYDYDPGQYGYYGTINPRGSWNWPMDEPIVINQGFGSHSFAKTFYPGGTHNGIDIDSNFSSQVKAVRPGKLYGGSYQCGGRYPGVLLYAKVEQSDGIVTWYLHMTPQ